MVTLSVNKCSNIKSFILFVFFVGILLESFGQVLPLDTLSGKKRDRIYFGIYFMPTLGSNFGNKIVPVFNEMFDCACAFSFNDKKESMGMGYNSGIEIEIKIAKKIYIGLGTAYEYYHYTGSTLATSYSLYYVPAKASEPFYINYSYKSHFFGLSLGAHYHFSINKLKWLNFYLAASGNSLNSEDNSAISYYNSEEYLFKKELTTFGIVGVDYFYGNKILLNIGFRITSQIGTTPHGRQLTSAGIKLGISY